MICPFCNKEMLLHCGNYICKNSIFICLTDQFRWFARYGFEFRIDNYSKKTTIYRYQKPNPKQPLSPIYQIYTFEEYCYTSKYIIIPPLFSLNSTLPITPNNFEHYYNKFKNLIPFS